MSIDEAIIQSRIQLTIWEEGSESKLDNSPKAVEMLIEIAKKYQKIEQIVEHWACCGNPSDSMIAISEVIEDGKIS